MNKKTGVNKNYNKSCDILITFIVLSENAYSVLSNINLTRKMSKVYNYSWLQIGYKKTETTEKFSIF